MTYVYYGKELYHHGIKGQKWGVRRTKEELNMDPESRKIAYKKLIGSFVFASNKVKITGVSDHVIQEKRRDRTQAPKDVIDSLIKPLKIDPPKYNDKGEPSIVYYGNKATTCINPEKGLIITSWVTKPEILRKLKGGNKNVK